MKYYLLPLIIFYLPVVFADPLQDSAFLANEILSNSKYTNVGDAQVCSEDQAGSPSRKDLLKANVKSAKKFGDYSSSECSKLTIFHDKNGKNAIGYYKSGETVRTFQVFCITGSSDEDCRKKLLSDFESRKIKKTVVNKYTDQLHSQPKQVAIDNVYVAKPVFLDFHVPKNAKLQGYTCDDGSLSAEQGPSWGAGGWEGRCGQTAATNLLYSLCGHLSSSLVRTGECSREEGAFNDPTPGVHPVTMTSDYNAFLKTHGCSTRTVTQGDKTNPLIDNYLNGKATLDQVMNKQAEMVESVVKAGKPNPTMFMIEVPGSQELHWISLNNIYTDKAGIKRVKVNHWGLQYDYPLSEMAKLTLKAGWGEGPVGVVFSDLNYVQVK